ncbi:MAG: lysophospholipid acyltransferase family protein [Patescibacteria group bacterium]
MEFFRKITYKIAWIILSIIFKILLDVKTRMPEELKNNKIKSPILIVSNHKAVADSFIVPTRLSFKNNLHPFHFLGATGNFESLATKVFKATGIIKFVYFLFGVIPVIRGVGLDKSLEKPIKALKAGKIVMIYPEGRVFKEIESIGSFRRGAAALAEKTGAAILPVAIKYFKGSLLGKKVVINFGKPFCVSGDLYDENDEYYAKPSEYIREKVLKLYEEI